MLGGTQRQEQGARGKPATHGCTADDMEAVEELAFIFMNWASHWDIEELSWG